MAMVMGVSGGNCSRLRGVARVLALTSSVVAGSAHAGAFQYSVTVSDPLSQATAYHSALTSHVGAALQAWGAVVQGSAQLEVLIEITNTVPRATGASVTSGFVNTIGGMNVFEQGMAYELRTGIDPNGTTADVRLQFNTNYLMNELWFDSDPLARAAAVPTTRTDAMSVMIHEFGHALAYNGWGNHFTGALPGDYASPWDMLVTQSNGGLYFNGAQAQAVYGAPVAVTVGNNFHIGMPSGTGSNLVPDLMNGVVYERGMRYDISALNIAMLQDMGVAVMAQPPIGVPEPGTLVLLAAAVATMGWRRRSAR